MRLSSLGENHAMLIHQIDALKRSLLLKTYETAVGIPSP